MTIRACLQLLLVTGAAFAALASATSTSQAPKTERVPYEPPPARTETVQTETAIDGIQAEARPAGAAGWRIAMKNNTDAMVTVVWDESTFASANGVSGGRLIRGETKMIDTAKTQPPSPIPPHGILSETVFVEKLVDAEKLENDYAKLSEEYGGSTVRANGTVWKARHDRVRAIVGGALLITVQLADGKKTWTGRILSPGAQVQPKELPANGAGSSAPVGSGSAVE